MSLIPPPEQTVNARGEIIPMISTDKSKKEDDQ